MRKIVFCLLSAVLCLAASATGVRMRHDIVLKGGWNAFYLPVTPDAAPDELFADWPTSQVGCYDPESYLRTAQFVQMPDDSTQGAVNPHLRQWVRGQPARSSLPAVFGGAVYIVNNTNAADFAATVYGEPRAMRNVWHATAGGTVPVNYLGVSTDGADANLTETGYLMGLDTGWIGRWRVGGRATLTQPSLKEITRDALVANGGAIAMDAARASEWSGPLFVSPALGFDLGTNGTMGVLKVRNDSGTNRTVRVDFSPGEVPEDPSDPFRINLPFPKLLSCDPVRQGGWNAAFRETGYVCELKAGETLALRLAVDREIELLGSAGTEYGGILRVTDVSPEGCTHFQTAVPFSAKADGGAFRRTKWPKGLWVADLTLDKVSQLLPEEIHRFETVVSTNTYWEVDEERTPATSNLVTYVETNEVEVSATTPVAAGAPVKLRLLVHVDYNGVMNLMQRARLGTRRVTAAVLPTDRPVLPGAGTFGVAAAFDWTVAETSRVNPFRHARHPDHDGLRADFKTPAPSGDDFNNYNSSVKPELFSVENAVAFVWNAMSGAAWSPEETLSGTCSWTLTGLRREGGIETTGTFTMKRISALDLDELKEDF